MTVVINGTTGITNDGGYTGDGVVFADTTPANTLVTTTGGNVGIGTSSPGAKLDVRGPSGGVLLNIQENDSGNNRRVRISNSGTVNTIESTTGVGSTQLAFSVDGFERARIDSSGNLLVGTTNIAFNQGAGVKINPAGDGADRPRIGVVTTATTDAQSVNYNLYSTGASAYRFYVGAGGTVYATNTTISSLSDVRFKENIRDLDAGLDAVMSLKPRLYDWKEGKGANIKNARGFIAQEFEQVFPDLIDEWRDPAPEGEAPYKSVRADLIPTLVKAIQEQQAIITAQAAQIQQLREKVLEVEEGTSNMLVENTNNLYETITALTARVAALEGTAA